MSLVRRLVAHVCVRGLMVIATVSVVILASGATISSAEELHLSHNCTYSILCYEYEYYDWWEVNAANGYDIYGKVAYDDPCDRNIYGLPFECSWTGPPYQGHNWELGAVELMSSEPVHELAIAVVKGSTDLLKVSAIGCKVGRNCFGQYSSLQTSTPGGYKEDHIAVAQGYEETCIFAPATEDELPCASRRLWGFEGDGYYDGEKE